MAHQYSFVSFFFVALLCWHPFLVVKCSSSDLFQPEYLAVPATEFLSSLQLTIETVRDVTSALSKFSSMFGDFRVSNAISDCLDLLDLSDDELTLTFSSTQYPSPVGKNGSTGNPSLDTRTWLSGALINQDTCIEGFQGTNTFVQALVEQSLNQITPLVHNILAQVHPTTLIPHPPPPPSGGGRKLITDEKFPNWLKSHDRKLLQTSGGVAADVVVAADGSGNFTSINDAISAAPNLSNNRFVIHIKKGVYTEYVEIHKKKWNIMLIGDGMDVTVVSGNRNFIDGWTTYRSATFGVKGQGFIARDITFQNIAGAEKHQAVAFRSDSDLSVLYKCAFRGYQDTLYAHSLRQFYKECTITGTVDFIFGDGSVVFQNCQIYARKGLPNQKNTVTAQGRKDSAEPTGFSIQFANISVEPNVMNSTETYLGRPWKEYSRTVIMQSYISDAIKPRGWLEWNGNFGLDSLYYGEYLNYGPGAGLGGRVNWTGFHAISDQAVANSYTVAQFITGNQWLPSTGVKYTAGLSD